MLLIVGSVLSVIEREHIRQVATFAGVGVLATLVHYSVALFVTEMLAAPVYFANIVGFIAAVMVSLFGHGALTFRKTVNRATALRFFVVAVAALTVSEMLLVYLIQYWALHHRISMAVVVMTIPLLSFVFNKFWVYR